MGVIDQVHGKGTGGDDFARGTIDHDITVAHVATEAGADGLEADGLAQGEVDGRELGLPVVDGQGGEDLGDGLGRGGAVAGEGGVDLVPDAVVPLLVGREVDEEPGGVDAGVELAGEEGA